MRKENDGIYEVNKKFKVKFRLDKKFILDDFYLLNNKFELSSIICMQFSNHYSCLIIKNTKEVPKK